ncbi:MAG: ectoine hydroxylase [Myxococcota bacterium]
MTRRDDYPSRVGGEASILPRKDPVLHGHGPRQGPLSAEQLESFDRAGFLALEDFFDEPETRSIRDEAVRLRESLSGSGAAEVVSEPGSGELRSIFAVHSSSDVFRRLARHPRLLGAATQILGSPVYIHQSRINYKPAFRGREFYWHSDFETWHVEDGMPRMRAVSASISLLENNVHNGPLMLVPGSHRHYFSCAGVTPERHYERSLRKQEYGVPEADVLEDLVRQGGVAAPVGPPGSVVLFDCNTMHGSNGNISPWPRSNLFFVYNSVENALESPFSGQAPRPEHIASRDFEPLELGD